jgi:hypothetical protein
MLKRISRVRLGSLVSLLAVLSACDAVPQSAPTPAPPPAPPQAATPPALPPPSPPIAVVPSQPWDVAPLAAGDWTYKRDQQGPAATFGPPNTEGSLEIRCRPQSHEIVISRLGSSGREGTLTIRTSSGDLSWRAQLSPDGLEMMMAVRPARDPGLDWIAFSRGRISVEVSGLPRLIVPVWAEISRVIEDCRG